MKDVPVFLPNSKTSVFRASRDQARELVEYGRAKWRRHCRAILLVGVFEEHGFSSLFRPDAALTTSAEKLAAIEDWARRGPGEK